MAGRSRGVGSARRGSPAGASPSPGAPPQQGDLAEVVPRTQGREDVLGAISALHDLRLPPANDVEGVSLLPLAEHGLTGPDRLRPEPPGPFLAGPARAQRAAPPPAKPAGTAPGLLGDASDQQHEERDNQDEHQRHNEKAAQRSRAPYRAEEASQLRLPEEDSNDDQQDRHHRRRQPKPDEQTFQRGEGLAPAELDPQIPADEPQGPRP